MLQYSYLLVIGAKYRSVDFTKEVDQVLVSVCLEIGTDDDHVHFLLQSVPIYSVTKIVKMIKV